ncbi:TIR domain-containing protein [Maribacter algarum]|uniref:TIR domain-containing protein n=1 Tax=Maribacter algarum (ex Zhang et al. 2020) TaxID=2578118 RepID=A0A5S3PQU3_9FLAO|nr:TIR domain-containing protein [Maribacter algarum]TMM57110.1 TIR domain-containing protein [Maribacter algarum]
MGENLNINTIYTSEDTAVMQHLVKRLKSSEKDAAISIWNDNPILPEQAWKPRDESRFRQTDIFILLVSDAFMHSQFIQQLEFKMVIDQYKAGKSTVIPIILDQCPWDIDFRSDDYNFNMNELGVLPEGAKPIKEWESSEQVYNDIAKEIKAVIASLSPDSIQEEPEEDKGELSANLKEEEQIAIAFDEEKEVKEDKTLQEEIEAKRQTEENRLMEEAEAKQRALEEQKLQKEAETKARAEEQRRSEAELKRKAEEQKLREAEESRKLEETRRKKEEAELKNQEEQERWKLEQQKKQEVAQNNTPVEETLEQSQSKSRKKFLIAGIIAALAIIGIWTFNSGTDEAIEPAVDTNSVDVEDSIPVEKTETEPVVEEESLPELVIGDQYDGGIVFAIDSDGKSGKVVHIDDAGPMPWADAMIIHDKLGKGWRLPTLDELKVLYNSLGQGASNSAEFADKLYWSATPYDEFQARLLQFRTGNTSYHYNKEAEHRQFLVRAVRDFTR